MPLGRLELRLARVGAAGRKDHLALCVRKRHVRHAVLAHAQGFRDLLFDMLAELGGGVPNPLAIASDRQAFSAARNCGEFWSIGFSALRANGTWRAGSGKSASPHAHRQRRTYVSSALFAIWYAWRWARPRRRHRLPAERGWTGRRPAPRPAGTPIASAGRGAAALVVYLLVLPGVHR